MKKLFAGLALVLSFAAMAPAPAAAQSGAAATTFTGEYRVRARGITAGSFTLSATFQGANYTVTASRRLTGLARTLMGDSQDYTYSVRGARTGVTLRPAAYRHQGGSRNRLVEAAFANDDVVTTATPRMGMGTPPATREQRRGVVDQLTALALMMITDGDPCVRTVRVYMDGRSRFDFIMTRNGTERVNIAGFRGDAIRCRVTFRPIAGFSDPQESEQLTFLFARQSNGMYAPLRIQMPTDDVGIVTLQAHEITLTGPRPN